MKEMVSISYHKMKYSSHICVATNFATLTRRKVLIQIMLRSRSLFYKESILQRANHATSLFVFHVSMFRTVIFL